MPVARVRTTRRFLLTFTLLLLCAALSTAAPQPPNIHVTKVACVGDSITFGYGLANPQKDAYPAQLGRLLGPQWEVRNFGVSATTMMNAGDYPYMKRPQYRAALDYKPDVLIIALGTNDSKPQNADAHPDDFKPSYEQMIAEFRKVNPNVRIFVCLPPPAFEGNFTIRENAIASTLIPQIRAIAARTHGTVIDLHAPLLHSRALFPDAIHPNEGGATLLAHYVQQALLAPPIKAAGKRVEARRQQR